LRDMENVRGGKRWVEAFYSGSKKSYGKSYFDPWAANKFVCLCEDIKGGAEKTRVLILRTKPKKSSNQFLGIVILKKRGKEEVVENTALYWKENIRYTHTYALGGKGD